MRWLVVAFIAGAFAASVAASDATTAYFDAGSHLVKREYRRMLESEARALREEAHAYLRIEGHCDEAGTEEYNLALAQLRADAVRSELRRLGAPDDRMDSVGVQGDEADHRGAARHRRVDLHLLRLQARDPPPEDGPRGPIELRMVKEIAARMNQVLVRHPADAGHSYKVDANLREVAIAGPRKETWHASLLDLDSRVTRETVDGIAQLTAGCRTAGSCVEHADALGAFRLETRLVLRLRDDGDAVEDLQTALRRLIEVAQEYATKTSR